MVDVAVKPTVDFYGSDALLTDGERDVRDRVRRFAEEHLRPAAREAWENATFPSHLLAPLAELGIAGGLVEGYGCPNIGHLAFGLAIAEISRVDSSFATFFGIDGGLVPVTIAAFGT